jgi:hypothetical protein
MGDGTNGERWGNAMFGEPMFPTDCECEKLRARVAELEGENCVLQAKSIDLSWLEDAVREEHEAAESAALEEVARLRGLLGECWEHYGPPDSCGEACDTLARRVREAMEG